MARRTTSAKPRKSRKKSTAGSAGPARRPRSARIPKHPGGAPRIRKQPRQQRSRDMVDAILQAAAEIFSKLGYARSTTNKIAERAGVSVGSLYQYFPNKDSLLASLMDKHHADVNRVLGRAMTRLADPRTPLESGLRQLLTDLMALHRENPELTRALSPAVLQQSSVSEQIHQHDSDFSGTHAVSQLLASRPDVRKGDHVAMAAVMGETTSRLTRWLVHDPPAGVDPQTLLDEVVELQVRYLKKDGIGR